MRPISVIIPVRNEGERIVRCVQSIIAGRSSRLPLELVVVDDASTDGACARLRDIIERTPEVRLVIRRLERWSGIPYARNRGAEAASYPVYLITDGNTKFPRNWDLPISRWFHPGRLLAGTIVDTASGSRGYGCTLVLPSMGATWLTTPDAYGGYVPVAACTCTVIDRSLFRRLGGYDESLPLYGAAEPEFSVRAWLSGYEIINAPDLLIEHRFRPKSTRDAFYTANQRVLLRNYLRFAYYYLPEILLNEAYKYFAELMPGEFDSCLNELRAGDARFRRIQLKDVLPRDFRWLTNKFGLVRL